MKQYKVPLEPMDVPTFVPRMYSVLLTVGVILIAGFWMVSRFTASDLARDMQTWQEKLNLIAESRAADVGGWVSRHYRVMRSLATNPSLQLYLSELQGDAENKKPVNVEPAQKTYLRNLILFTAEQNGFGSSSRPINANVPEENRSGLAVLNNAGQIVVSTSMSPTLATLVVAQVKAQPRAQEFLIDIQKDAAGELYLGFGMPVYSIQGDQSEKSQVGTIVAIKPADETLFGLLKHPGVTEQTLETLLLRANDQTVDYLSPLQDGGGALARTGEPANSDNAEIEALRHPGSLVSDKDYREHSVLATARAIAGTPWSLAVKVDRREALADSTQYRNSMATTFFLVIVIAALVVAVAWWYAHSKRAMHMSRYFRTLAAQTRAQEQLLRVVTDHQPEATYILDDHYVYHFANRKSADEAGMDADAIAGKTLTDVRGAARAHYLQKQVNHALKQNRIVHHTAPYETEDGGKVVRAAFVPLKHIPVATLPEPTPGVLVVEDDITEAVQEREKRLEIQNHLIQTLVKLVDKRDPFSANHSLMVSQLAHKIAADMGLATTLADTARIAGSLMNIGKIVVPTELLTKTGKLTPAEKRAIQDSMNAAAELLKDIDFDGPVSQTLSQWQEKWDGSGPLGVKGEAIVLPARIIAVANAFIGMVSPRSWRTAIPIDEATKFLLDQCDTHFDRRVVIALVNYLENHDGKAWVAHIVKDAKNAGK